MYSFPMKTAAGAQNIHNEKIDHSNGMNEKLRLVTWGIYDLEFQIN